jgi:hypothetical protein
LDENSQARLPFASGLDENSQAHLPIASSLDAKSEAHPDIVGRFRVLQQLCRCGDETVWLHAPPLGKCW